MESDRDPLVVGILGLGSHGIHYADLITELGHEVMGADADPQVREEFAEQFDAETYERPEDLFDADIDAVTISTPTKFHEAVATQALEAGHHVFLEKPLADSLEGAERIVETAERTGNICMLGFYHRFRNHCDVLKSYIDEGTIGDLIHIDAKYVRRRGVPGRGTWYTSKKLAGGGALMDIGCHLLDLLLYFSDWPDIQEVIATSRSDFGNREDYAYLYMWGDDDEAKMYDVEDSVRAFIKFESGMTASIEVAWAANVPNEHSYRIEGTSAGAELSIKDVPYEEGNTANLELYETQSGGDSHLIDSTVTCNDNEGYDAELQTFVDAIESDERPEKNNVEQALQVQRVVDQIYRAAEQ